ncbi:MAG: phenylalanine--tRNA ligase subunit beta [Actinobacteria bacterium]|nr:phenylalanine--tRNA ligase subunit beta [Actinomycetota bacterium]
MKVPMSWLRDYVRVDTTADEVADLLSIATAEVIGIHRRGPIDTELFKVGRVLTAEKHPNADRLQLTTVDVGDGKVAQIVCGAWNFGAGATVAVALPGATLPNGVTLERRELRGEMSEGMILAEDEVDLGTDHDGIMLLADGIEPGTPLVAVLPIVEEILDVEPTGNRPDLLSVYGVAREVAALLDTHLRPLDDTEPELDEEQQLDIRIDDLEGAPRYIGRLFRDVSIGPSPLWLQARVRDAGMRPISNVVDITNYVMLALGNPLHAFDYDALAGGRIVVRRAAKGEKIRTLDGVERALTTEDLMIADAERAVALAGIMGGEETEVLAETTTVLLEAANFEPVGILRSSERLALRTEGSNRWEKGVDPYLAGPAATLATRLIVELTGARWVASADVHGDLPARRTVPLRPQRTDDVLGHVVPAERQASILAKLGFERDAGDWAVPTWRARDVTREIDLVEEVARFELGEIPFTLPAKDVSFGRLTRGQKVRRTVEDALLGCGFSEAYTPSFPVTAETVVLRTQIAPSLVEAARTNLAVDNTGIALFEVARVYGAEERRHVAGIVEGGIAEAKWAVEQIYAALKLEPAFERTEEPLLHPGKAARTAEGWVGELHPRALEGTWGAFELDLDALAEHAPQTIRAVGVSPFPELRQDLAFAVGDDVPAAAVLDAIRIAGGAELRDVAVFDEYRGEQIGAGRRSLAFRVVFGSDERTLTDEEAAVLRAKIVDAVRERFGAELRA